MSILGGIGKTIGGIGRAFVPKKKPVVPQQKNFLQESAEEYAERLMQRRSKRY